MTAFGAAALKDIRLGGHAGAETMHLVLACDLWLVGSFWHDTPSIRVGVTLLLAKLPTILPHLSTIYKDFSTHYQMNYLPVDNTRPY